MFDRHQPVITCKVAIECPRCMDSFEVTLEIVTAGNETTPAVYVLDDEVYPRVCSANRCLWSLAERMEMIDRVDCAIAELNNQKPRDFTGAWMKRAPYATVTR